MAGVIYLHRISCAKMGGISKTNFRLFRSLCGTGTLVNVVIATTFWDKADPTKRMERMTQLETNQSFFRSVIETGGKIRKHNDGLTSAYSILDVILANQPKPLQIQEEMGQGKDMLETAAGSELDATLTELISKGQKKMGRLQTKMATIKAADEVTKGELREECEKLKADLKSWREDKMKLREGLVTVKAEVEAAKGKSNKNLNTKGIALLQKPNREKNGSELWHKGDENVKKVSRTEGYANGPPPYSPVARGITRRYRDQPKDVGGDTCGFGGRAVGDVVSEPDAIILIMGSTGSGKSMFINSLTNDPEIRIGHTIKSETEVVRLSSFLYKNERSVTLVDTPGWDGSREGVTDTDWSKNIAAFLKEEYDDNRKMAGVIYLHRISDPDPRMSGLSKAKLRLFRSLCGTDTLVNVVIATTFWDKVSPTEGMKRMTQLKTSFFSPVIAVGGKIMSHDDGLTSAYSILDAILANQPKPLQIQEEMRQGKDVSETAAGSELDARFTEQISKYQEEMQELQSQMTTIKAADVTKGELKTDMKRWGEDKKKLEEGLVKAEVEAAKAKANENLNTKHIALLVRPSREDNGIELWEADDDDVKKESTVKGYANGPPSYSPVARGINMPSDSKSDFTEKYRDRAKDVGGDIYGFGGRTVGGIVSKPGRVFAQTAKAIEAFVPESEHRIERDMEGYADRVEKAARQGGHLAAQFCPGPTKGIGRLAGGTAGALAAEGVGTVQGIGRLGKSIVKGVVRGL